MRVCSLVVALALAGPSVAQDRCLIGCDDVSTGATAANQAAALLGPLPKGAGVVGLVQGGFQDAFVQLRIEVAEPALVPLLKMFGVARPDLVVAPAADLGPSGPAWWDAADRPGLLAAEARLDGFAYARVAAAPPGGPDGTWTIYLWAFQT